MFVLKHANGTFIRVVKGLQTQFVTGGSLAKAQDLLILDDLWTATQFQEKTLKGHPLSIIEVELRELRIIPPVIDNEAQRKELSKLD